MSLYENSIVSNNNVPTGSGQPIQKGEIYKAMDILNEETRSLEAEIKFLVEKIKPVLNTNPETIENQKRDHLAYITDLAKAVDLTTNKIVDMVDGLKNINQRIEL